MLIEHGFHDFADQDRQRIVVCGAEETVMRNGALLMDRQGQLTQPHIS